MLLRSTALHNKLSKLTWREKRLTEKNVKCPKAKLKRICLKESFHREKRDKEKPSLGLKNSRKFNIKRRTQKKLQNNVK
jgi:hypothetical protein